MQRNHVSERAIFGIARRISLPAARAEYLRQVCGDDDEQIDRVNRLLLASEESESFLALPHQTAAADSNADAPASIEQPGERIGPYKLIEEIGEGGMGIVYLALQDEPVRRKVALKVIKPGMDTREVIARFSAEQQALAMLDHHNIAHMFDAGATQSGRPYFVMELVEGVRITEYCDDANLTTRRRLELFCALCAAVQHAHQKGIIHRDLKPSNILVALQDGVPVPKIIDFGIAKAVDLELNPGTPATRDGHMVGTPLYMSPEQAENSSLDIDTRSDIYSLGVLLYELLTGSTPFDRQRLKDVAYDEVQRVIREVEPPRPSTRISTMGRAATTAAEHRRTTPVGLSNSLRHELDWIVMKALEKDRTRRYPTAGDFAQDIDRYLHDQPVAACPPSTRYRLGKFVRRNKTAVLATLAVAVSLCLGTGIATWQAVRATEAEQTKDEQLQFANNQRRLADEATEREADQRKHAEAVTKFLVDVFRSPDPDLDGREITVAELLDQAKTRIETEFKGDPVLQAKFLCAIGQTYLGLGLFDEALRLTGASHQLLREQLGAEAPETLATAYHFIDAQVNAGKWNEALPLAQANLKARQKVLGPQHRDTLQSMGQLAGIFSVLERPLDALPLAENNLKFCRSTLRDGHEDTLDAMCALAEVYYHLERYDESVRLSQQQVALAEKAFGPEHLETLAGKMNLAMAYSGAEKFAESLQLEKEILPLIEKKLGRDHPHTLRCRNNLAESYIEVGRIDEGIRLHEETLSLLKKKLGPEHPNTLISMSNLASAYTLAGRHDEATKLHEQAAKLRKKVLPQHPNTYWSVIERFAAAEEAGQREAVDAVAPLAYLALHALAEIPGPLQLDIVDGLQWGALVKVEHGEFDEAASLLQKVLRIKRKRQGAEHPDTLKAVFGLGHVQMQRAKYTEAEPLLLEAYKGFKQRRDAGVTPEDEDEKYIYFAALNLVELYRKSGATDKAAAWKEKLDKLKPHEAPKTTPLVPYYGPRCAEDEGQQ